MSNNPAIAATGMYEEPDMTMPTQTMTALDVLIAARARVAKAWTQGTYLRNGVACCTRGAIHMACGAHDGSYLNVPHELDSLCESAGQLLRRAIGTQSLTNWNDAPERTHPEVLAAFDKAIALARQEQEGAAQ